MQELPPRSLARPAREAARPVAVVLVVGARRRRPSCSRSRPRTPAPAPVAAAPKPGRARGPEALAKVKLGRRSSERRGSSLGAFDPSNPFAPPKGSVKKDDASVGRRDGPSTGEPAARPAPAAPAHRVRPAAAAAARPAGGGGTTGGGTGGGGDHHHRPTELQLRRRRDLHGERPHAPHQGPGEARHAAEPGLAAADLHGRHADGPATRCSSWTRRSRPPARASASRAHAECAFLYIGAGSEHEFTNEDGDSYRLRIDEIRKVKVGASPAASRERREGAAVAHARAPPSARRRRFVLPIADRRRSRVQATARRLNRRHRTADRGVGQCAALITICLLALAALLLLPLPRCAAPRSGPAADRSRASSRCASASATC